MDKEFIKDWLVAFFSALATLLTKVVKIVWYLTKEVVNIISFTLSLLCTFVVSFVIGFIVMGCIRAAFGFNVNTR